MGCLLGLIGSVIALIGSIFGLVFGFIAALPFIIAGVVAFWIWRQWDKVKKMRS